MANKKPKNKYDPLEGLSPEEKRQIEQQRNIFGLSSQEPQETIESKTKANNVMVEEDVLDESSLDAPEIIVEDNAEDAGELFGDVTYENIFNHTSVNNNAKTEKKDARKKSKTASVDNDNPPEDILPEDAGEILGDVSTPTSAIDKAIRDSVSDFRETTDGGLNKTEDDIAYEEERTREFRERNAQNNDIIEEERTNAEEEATQALEEALKAQEALDALAEDANDVSGQKGKGKKKKKGKSAERRLENNTENAPVLVRPSTSSTTPTNFTKPEAPKNQGLSPTQSDSDNIQPTYMPSGNIPEGNSGVARKHNNNASDEASASREDTANKNNSVANIESQSVKAGTTDVYLDTGTKDTIIPNTDSPVIYDNDYIPQKETVRISTDVPEFGIVRETAGVSPQPSQTLETAYGDDNSKSPVISNYDTEKKEPLPEPVKVPADNSQLPQNNASSALTQTYNETQSSTPKGQIAPLDNNADYSKINAPSQQAFVPTEKPFVENKPITPASIESIQFKPHHANIGQAVSNAENNNSIHNPASIPIKDISAPVSQASPTSYIEEVKRTISNYVEPSKEVVVTETGSYITVSYDNKTVSIPKTPDIKPQSIPAENYSPAFDALVKKAVDGLQKDMPPVYSGNDIKTTEVVSSSLNKIQNANQWNIDDLNNNLKRDLGTTAILQPTENHNVYAVFKGTDNEAYITFHPISHRVTNVEYVGNNPTQTAVKDISAIQRSAQSYADYCRTTENAFDYLSRKISQPQQEVISNSPMTRVAGASHVPFNRVVTNATQLTITNAPNLSQGALGYISTQYSNTFNPYTSALSSGAIAMRLRNSYTMVMPNSLMPQKGISPEISRLIALQEISPIASELGENAIIASNLENDLIPQLANGTTKTSINDPSRATKLADKATDIIHPNQFYSAINPAYNLSPLRNTPDFRSVINTARGLGIYVAMQVRQTAMQNPVGEGMQQMATYTILPLQIFHKVNPYGSLMTGLKYLPNYNSSVSTFVKEARTIGISCIDNPTLFQITNISNRVYVEARALGFEPGQLTQTQIASELVKRQKWITDATQRPAGKSVEHINKEMNTLKAISSVKELHFTKANVSSFYINFFKENGITLPPNIANLTDKGQFAMLRSIVDREIGGKYGIKDISQMSAVRLESLMKTYKFTDKELNILRLLSTPEMTRFSRLMKKADRRAMHFMLFLQRVIGQNDATQGAIKTFRWLRTVRTVIHYTRRVSRLTQRILMRVAHRHGWDKVIKANRVLTRNGRIIKNAPKKASKTIGKGIKKGAKTASKNLAKTAVGKSVKKVSSKFAQSTVGKIAKGSLEAIAKTSAKVASKAGAIAAKKAAIEASISEALGGAFGIGSGTGATAVGAGAGAGGSAAGAGAGAGGAALEGTPVGWVITIVVVVILIIATLFVTVGPLITQSLEEDREARVYETIIEKLTEYDKGFIEGMKAIKINQLKDKGDTQVLVDNSITSNEATRFNISGYYDPSKEAPAQLEEWGWGDALDASSVPANKTASKLDPSSVNNLYDAHNRGAIFQFTDSPKYVFNLHSEKDGILPYDYVENEEIKNIPFTSNTREILAAVSTITEDQYTTLDNHYTGGIGTNYAQLLKGYAYGGIRVKADIAGETGTGVKEGFTSASLWSATHGYQTATSKLYTCNGCQKLENVSDFNNGYYCNSEEWKKLSNTSTFMYNKPTLSELSANEKTLPYNSLGCYQHKQTTSAKYMEKSGKEYYCGNYHKTSSGKYVQCISSNNTVLYGDVVGHSYTDIYGLKPVSGHIQTNCQYYDVVFAGEKTVTESGYIQDKQYYNHNCPDFNVKGCSNYIDVSSHFGTTAYLITQSDFGIGGDFDRPSCASYTDQIKVVHGNNSTTYRLVYCTGHHKCNTNTKEKNTEPTKKTIYGSFYIYYGGNHNDKGTFIINGVSSVEPTFELTVKDYCMHYKTSSATFDYQLYKKVCKGHCDGHNETNNDHPCVYCIGHKDKEINAYIISSLDSNTQESKLYGGKEGHWDNLPFNTIYSADTCSGPIALAHDDYMDSNVFDDVADTIDQTWMLTMFRYNDWYKNERHTEKYDFLNKDKTAISTAQNMRQSAETKLLSGWNEIYNSDIFAKVSKTGYGEYFGYFSSTVSTEWDYIESQIIRRDATEQQKYFVQWAINSCGKVPYSPNGKVKGVWYDSVTKTNINGFGTVTSPDSAGRILKGLNESQWLNWCYASAFSSAVKELPNGDRVYINSLAPPLDESTSVPLKEITDNLNKKYTLNSDNPEKGFTNLPTNAKNIQFIGTTALKEGVQAGDIIVLRKKCPLCSKMFNSDKIKCDDCNISLTQDFAIVIGWTDYAKSTCENSSCAKKGKAYKDDTVCPQCGQRLTRSIKPKGDDLLVVEMSSDACEEVVCIKRYDERAFDLSNGGNKYVVCRFLN